MKQYFETEEYEVRAYAIKVLNQHGIPITNQKVNEMLRAFDWHMGWYVKNGVIWMM